MSVRMSAASDEIVVSLLLFINIIKICTRSSSTRHRTSVVQSPSIMRKRTPNVVKSQPVPPTWTTRKLPFHNPRRISTRQSIQRQSLTKERQSFILTKKDEQIFLQHFLPQPWRTTHNKRPRLLRSTPAAARAQQPTTYSASSAKRNPSRTNVIPVVVMPFALGAPGSQVRMYTILWLALEAFVSLSIEC